MYHALYRKWRPQKFADVVGQEPIVTALQNQIASGRIGHAYLFTGTRGTGKTTCAKIFAKAINCLDHSSPDPCGECEVCRGIDEGTVLDISEIDAASNNSVDDIRDLRDETAFLPTVCQYKVYIIDEVHMLSTSAFNALLKTMEEPPPHVIFILATTEVQKVPATILSRCQRYDFARITADKIAGRLLYVASQESFTLTEGAAALIGRLADGAMRDALSILDTCAGVSTQVDEALVRRMAGVTDRAYLFEISDAIAKGDAVAALQKVAELRQQSVDMRRLCTELAGHYRNLMLSSLPQGTALLSGISPEEEAAYSARASTPQADAVRGIEAFGEALEKMGRGADQRIELELAIFSLTQPAAQPAVQVVQQAAPAAQGQPAPFASGPAPFAAQPVQPAVPSPAAPAVPPAGQPVQPPVAQPEEEAAPWQAAPANPQAFAPEPSPPPAAPAAPAVPPADRTLRPFAPWPQVLEALSGRDPAMSSFLRGSGAFYDGRRVLIDCNETFRDYMRQNKETNRLLKQVILEVSGIRCGIGPYEKPQATAASGAPPVEDTLKAMQSLGVDVVVEDK
ncbi:MAG TPA: DNA polymerase III subunit gamma/tau [Candidatus Gemmiger stercorigallinarum]|nr:DNA polymerase III subunit gamma/tau [Candidatus Gemmiger stercorigallinarum]